MAEGVDKSLSDGSSVKFRNGQSEQSHFDLFFRISDFKAVIQAFNCLKNRQNKIVVVFNLGSL